MPVDPVIGERLPFDGHHPLADVRQIGEADEGPFCSSPHIDQNGVRVAAKARPDLLDGEIVDTQAFVCPHVTTSTGASRIWSSHGRVKPLHSNARLVHNLAKHCSASILI